MIKSIYSLTKNHFCTKVRERRESHVSRNRKDLLRGKVFSSTFVQDSLHEVVDRVPVIVVPDLAVEVSQVGAVEDRTLLLDKLEEEGVLGALQADGPQSRKTEKKKAGGKGRRGRLVDTGNSWSKKLETFFVRIL